MASSCLRGWGAFRDARTTRKWNGDKSRGYGAAIAVAGAVTRFGNQPINDQIISWSASAPPPDWVGLRDEWWTLHLIRVAASFVGEVLLIAAIFVDRAA